ncbi:MAG: aconitase X catalytic domain-containing protein [Gammaproteobacteria bacterium]|jgi:predicted aconitase|nr:aconitase X catalytic domain-containing protein [Gammaproteobacteria bacterium]MDX2462397.1 aconitase X catalytic domain-containing protein [Gammaproteobacteria bacterium]
MRLTDIEEEMRAGRMGPVRRKAIEQQIQVGTTFDAEDFVEVSQVHLMADTESLGESGVEFLEGIAALPEEERRVRVPTVTDPRGIDLCAYEKLHQDEHFAELERRTIVAMQAMGILMTDTCINYQTILPPVRGEHLAFGDTGSTIYANSVCGARSNFEGGPAALAAALTGRVPRYGCHLERGRRGTHLFEVKERPSNLSDWGALGALIGQHTGSYWTVPVITGIDRSPTSDELKHFGAALASYGSVPLFHMPGVTPEATNLESVFDHQAPDPEIITRADLDAFYASFGRHEDKVDVVVFAAPQLSLMEMQDVARLLKGRRVHRNTALLIATSPENKTACDRMGITETIESSGAMLLKGVCFYQMYARELGEANGWQRLVSNSAKLVNIISGYGYRPVLATTEACVDAAVNGRM